MKLNRLINGLHWQRSRVLLRWRGPLATLALFVLIASGFALVRASAGEQFAFQWPESLSRIFGSRVVPTLAPAPFATTYTWNQTGTASWVTAANWTPTRTTPATDDILVFDNAATTTVTNVPAETIGQLQVSNSTNVTLQAGASGNTLAISGGAGSLNVGAGSQLNVNTAAVLNINLPSGTTGSVSGSMSFSAGAHRLTAVSASGITFQNGSSFTGGTAFTGNAFGTTNLNSILFANGSQYIQVAGSNPFAATQPSSVVVFQTGSLYKVAGAGITPSFAGRTYANVEFAGSGTSTATGTAAVAMDNLKVTSGTVNVNLTTTSGHSIKGDISVATGATLTFSPGSAATMNLNGTSGQTISGAGTLTINSNQTISVSNSAGVTLQRNVATSGPFNVLTGGVLQCGTNVLSGSGSTFDLQPGGTLEIGDANGITTSSASGNVQVSGTRTYSTGANYVYNGTDNQVVGDGLPSTVANLKISNAGVSSHNTVTGNSNQVVTGTLEVQTGIYSSHSDYVDVLIDLGGTLSLAADITVSGNWTNNGTFNNGGFKVTFDGASNQTIGGSNLSAFATLAISNSGVSGNNTVSLAQNISDTALNVTSGIFDQGASYNLASGAVTISGGATWKDIGTGDITLSGGVANSGTVNINGGTAVCGETQDVSIGSTAGQRAWSGFGTFVIKDVHVSNQGGLALIHVENGADDGGNGLNWIFTPATCTGGTFYTWNPPAPGTDSKYTTQINWTPTRATTNAADILVVDGTTTPTTTISDIPTQTIGRFRFINGTAATLSASAANTLTISGEGSAVFDFDVAGSSQVKMSGSNPLTVSLATGATGNIDNLLSFEGTGNKLIAADANAITFPSATNCTVLAGYSGNPFGTGSPGDGANGSVIFNTDSIYTHFSGNSPFGDASHNVVVFSAGSLARFYTATGFEASGRAYANLEIGNASTEVDATANGTGTFRFDNLTVNNTASQDSSLTFTGSGAGSILIFGNIRSIGAGIGAGATVANVSLTSGSGGIQISNGAGITFDNIGNSRSILFGSDATVASGTNLSLGRIIQNNFLNPNAVLTVNGSITPNAGAPGYIVGNEQRIFTGPGPVDFTFDVGGPAAYSPLDAKNTSGAGSLTVQAKEPGLSSITGANKLERYWTLTGTGITTDLTFHYRGGAPAAGDVNGNEANYAVFKFNGNFSQPPNQSVNTVNHTATVTGVNSFSSWTLAEPSAVPATTDVSLSSGNLVIGDVNGDDTDDTLTISLNGSNVRITDLNHTLNCGTGATTINANTCEVPFASITGNIQVNTLGGNDSLTVDLAGGDCIPNGGLSYDGGAQTSTPGDKLVITGGSQGTVTYNYTNGTPGAGSVGMSNFGTVNYTGLEPLTNSGDATDIIFNLPAGPTAVTLGDDGVSNNLSRLSGATFETTDFDNPSNSLTINRGDPGDTLAVNALPDFNASLAIGSGVNPFSTITFNGAITLAAGKNLSGDASSTISLPNAASDLTTSGTGSMTLSTLQNIVASAGSSISVVNGAITLTANQATPTAGTFVGIDLDGATLTTSGTGNISLTGKGGDTGTANHGVKLQNAARIDSTNAVADGTTQGKIIVNGTGGAGTSGNSGIHLVGTAALVTQITSLNGNIEITGTADGAGPSAHGLFIQNSAQVISTGTAKINVNGTGSSSAAQNNVGVYLTNAATVIPKITSVTGDISVTGTGGGNGASTLNGGVRVESGSQITSTGAAKVTVQGTRGNGTDSNYGVTVTGSLGVNSSLISSVDGDVVVTGQPGGTVTGNSNHGVEVSSAGSAGARIASTGNAKVTVNGTGGNGNLGNFGVYLKFSNAAISSVNGDIAVTGQGGAGAGNSNYGVHLVQGTASNTVQINSTGAAKVTINGTGGGIGTGTNNYGVWIIGSTFPGAVSRVSSTGGDISITGTGGNATSIGLNLTPKSSVIATGAANITLIADQINIDSGANPASVTGASIVSVRPKTTNTPIALGAADFVAGLGLTDAELDRISATTLNLGDVTSGTITVSEDITRAASTIMSLVSGGDVVISGGQVNTGGGTLLLDPGVSPFAVKPTWAGTDVTASTLSFGSDLAIAINGLTVDTEYDQLNVAGIVDLTGVSLVLSGSHTPVVGETFTIVNNDSTDSIIGTFSGLAEGASIPNFLGSPLSATITYQGGTNNDVVLTVAPATTSDLTVTKSAPASVPEGSDFTYTITVSNSASATATATGVSVSDILPAGVTFVSVTPSPACSESAGTVTCTGLPDIPAGGSDTVEILVTAGSAPATIVNTASASATNDPNSPKTSTAPTAIITCPTEFVVNSTGDGSDVNPGDGICETGAANGVCTLRAAIEEANAFNDACGYLTVKFAIPDNDPGHVYYKDDGVPNQVTNDLAHIGVTTQPVANDSSIGDIDPDYPHSWWRIQPAAGLPSINVALDIDGYTQSGASKNTKHLNEGDDAILRIEIDGSQTAFGTNGLTFTEASGDYSVITGLVINHFNGAHDLFVDDEGGHIFSGNFLGVDVSGTLGDGTEGTGIYLNSGWDTLIGGDFTEDRNVISGHGGARGAGIRIKTSDTTVEGNYIGTDRNGAVAIPNTYGVIITGGDGNVIGCEVLDGDNVISGNTNIGVGISDGAGNLVQGNFIGTDKTGQLPIPNKTGIVLNNSFLNFIGFGFGNVISGNKEDGVVLKDGSLLNIVQSNLIGVTFVGNLPLGNGGNGVEVYTGSTDNLIGEFPPGGTIARLEARAQSLNKEAGRAFKESAKPAAKAQAGQAQAGKAEVRKARAGKAKVGARKQSRRDRGPRPSFREFFDQRLAKVALGAAKKQAFVNKRSSASKGASAANIAPEICGCPSGVNTIANNTGDGVKVSSDGDLYNWISQNSIYSNGGLGINLVKNDPSTEPPSTVTANDPGDGDLGPNELQNFPVILSASEVTGIVHLSFDTCDEGPYIIEFFANAAGCDPSGHGEGQTYLGFIEVPGSGTYDSDPLSLNPGDVITATATDYFGNTSEFSACFALAPAVVADVSVALNGATSVSENGATNLVYRFTRSDTSAPLTVNFSATGTASSSTDYVLVTGANVGFNGSTGTVTFGTGVDHVDVTVDPTADFDFESSETVILTVTSGSGYNVVNPSSATGTITDDDCPTSFLVTHAIDTQDAVPGDGNCGDSLQRCTLRAAIEEANALVNCGTIDINFDFSTETIIALGVLGQLSVQHNVNINGPTTYFLSISGNDQHRAFQIDPGKIVSISNLSIIEGIEAGGDGGGILNNGTLTLKGVTVDGNSAVNGGGIASLNNSLTLINTTISGNTSTGNGGGLYNANGIATLTNVTIAYNTADSDGVGSQSGGGIFITSGDVTLHNTIVTDNLKGLTPITSADDVSGVNLNAASSYNLIGTGSGGLLNGGNNNQVGVTTALLKPLQENGGSTRTHALVYNSPAVDSGDDCVVTGCSGNSPVVNTDQRGKSRPSDGDNNGSSIVDIGAYERQVTEVRNVLPGFDSTVDVVDAIITFPCAEPPCIGSRVNPGSAQRDSGVAPAVALPTASLTLIDAAPLNSLSRPPNTAIGNTFNPPLPAFEVTTTATYTPPATVCFYLPSITNPTFFNGLRVLHREAGPNTTYGDSDDVLVDVTRADNPRNFADKLVCSEVSSFSAFAIAQTVSVNPTAENATVSGQILDNQGNPVEGATVRMSGTQNRLTITDAEGRYHFDEVETNGFYVLTPSRANFTFSPAQRSFSQLGATTEATFTGAAGGGGLNPLDVTEYFVRQQYLDFLGREPDNSGFNFWVNNIESCGNDIGCRESKRVDTSAAFFLSIESQQTGYLIYRFYQAAFGEIPNAPVPLRLSEYTGDAAQISKGVVVLQTGWQRALENNTRAFAEDFVKRDRFVAAYPLTMTPAEFVDKLFANGQIPLIDGDHAAAIAEFTGAPDTSDASARARALRRIAENSVLARRHFNRAFVLMEYFGYLRRDPNSGQDRDFSGFNFWLDKLDRFDGNFRDAEMVKAFLNSIEYRTRLPR